ncbi:MAG: DUF4136 domain-containing protein [Planctomycetota bacterium]|jgi:hypothetical protein
MKSFYTLVIFSLGFLLSGCSMTTVNYDYDTAFDFSNLTDYGWLDIPDDFPATEIVVQRIKSAVDQQMGAKGFKQVSESPDFLISLQGFRDIIRQEVERGTAYRGYRGYDRGYDRRVEVYEYEEGTLTLTIINTGNNALIWEGSATMEIEPNRSTEAKAKRTQEVVTKLLANFPPTKK